jgi:hypothetical protein
MRARRGVAPAELCRLENGALTNRLPSVNELRTLGTIFCIASLGFFAIPLMSEPRFDELTLLSGTVINVTDHTGTKAGPHLRVRLSTLPPHEWISIQYDSASRDDVHQIERGDALDIRAYHDSLGRDIWFARDVRSGRGTVLSYDDFMQQRRSQHHRLRIAGIVCVIAGGGLVLGTALPTRKKSRLT